VARLAVWLSGLMPFGQAAEVLEVVGQIGISATSIWRLTKKWTTVMEAIDHVEQEKAYALPLVGEHTDPDLRMGASMDGVMIPIREEGWKEAKIGSVYKVGSRPTRDPLTQEVAPLGCAEEISYVAHLGKPEPFGQAMWAEARRRGWSQDIETQVIGDAATWIWNLTKEHFYKSYQTVDWCHGVEHLATAAHAMYGDREGAILPWLGKQKKALFLGDAMGISASLQRAAERHPSAADDLNRESHFFEKQKRRMNYLEMRNEGWVIGSGTVESGAKQIKHRLAGPGMQWDRPNAQRMLLLRTKIMSRTFRNAWSVAYKLPPN